MFGVERDLGAHPLQDPVAERLGLYGEPVIGSGVPGR
jgi:hypothetical protein